MLNIMKKSQRWITAVLSTLIFMTLSVGATPLVPIEKKVIVDSEEDWPRRIYAYDMAVESNGDVHIVYQKPTSENNADIFYLRRSSGTWSEQRISTDGFRPSLSTRILVDTNNVVHISYIKNDEKLYYLQVVNNIAESEKSVSPGGWHTRMQLDSAGHATFIREGEDWHVTPAVSKLVLVTTTDGQIWSEKYVDLPEVNKFRIGEFIYENGVYHVTYGDSNETRPVVEHSDGTFHNLYYASSSDGVNWTSNLVDGSTNLYEMEFWTALIVDNGNPVIGWYQYAEYGGKYNTGTSAWLATRNGNNWTTKNITSSTYPETREGMGIGLGLVGPSDYLGGWDFSPADTHDDDFRGARGNIALARSASSGARNGKWQVDEFSAEGEVRLRVMNNSIYILVLGDYIDAKLYFYEYDIGVVDLPPLCASGERVKQGTNICISGTELPFGGPFLVDYDGYIQGSDVHDPNAQPTPISKFLEGMSQ